LIKPGRPLHAKDPNCLEQPQCTERIGIGGVFRSFETYLYMALRREIIDLMRLYLLHDADKARCIGHVAVV
jgi:hypothetical protein